MENDLKLWEKIQNGDTQALKLLHDRYYYPFYFYARKLYHNHNGLEEAENELNQYDQLYKALKNPILTTIK